MCSTGFGSGGLLHGGVLKRCAPPRGGYLHGLSTSNLTRRIALPPLRADWLQGSAIPANAGRLGPSPGSPLRIAEHVRRSMTEGVALLVATCRSPGHGRIEVEGVVGEEVGGRFHRPRMWLKTPPSHWASVSGALLDRLPRREATINA